MSDLKKIELLMLGALGATERAIDPVFTLHRAWLPETKAKLDGLAPRVRGIVNFSTTGWKIDQAFFERFPKVEIVANMGVGYETVDVPACRARGVVVVNTPGANKIDVAEVALGMMIALGRDFAAGDRHVREGKWPRGRAPTVHRLKGQTVGVLGLGQIGLEVARLAAAFGMEVAYHNRKRRTDAPYRYVDSLLELAKLSDYLVVAAPASPETKNIVNRSILEALGPEGTLINVGRGTLVDEAALLEMLQQKKLKAAGLDVFAQEPSVPEGFFALDNVLLQPHRGGDTFEALDDQAQLGLNNLRNHFTGQPVLTPVP
jgi:lactate dehydrogenase-like 2-hydroxyacid dehydrogenase